MDIDFILLILAVIGGDFAIMWQLMSLKDEVANNRVQITNLEHKQQEEFGKCRTHPCREIYHERKMG